MAIPFTGKRPPKLVAKSTTDDTDLRVGEVFVVGGTPTYTYIDRTESGMADQFCDAMDDGGKIITISGPTKSGKTVFSKQMLANTCQVRIPGGSVTTAEDVWTAVVHRLDGATMRQTDAILSEEDRKETGGDIGVNAFGLTARGERRSGRTTARASAKSKIKVSSLVHEATDLLLNHGATLVIDDFHYLDEDQRVRVVRALKGPLEDGLRVVFLCVPHHAIEPIRAEREMQGRIAVINVPDWRADELQQIAARGFAVLNVTASSSVLEEFILESFGSPHLMQEFCKHLCRLNNVRNKQLISKALRMPARDEFFRRTIDGGARDVVQSLAAGPLSSKVRMQRNFVGGESGDIYVAVLRAIANTGPKTTLTYNELRESLKGILADEPPAAHEITRVLEKISQISKDRFGDRGAIDFDEVQKVIYIVDPFVAFYMRWGPPIGSDIF